VVALLAARRDLVAARELKSNVDCRSILPTKLVATATSLDVSKNFRSFTYSHTYTIPANWVKIGLVDVQIKGLTESFKEQKKETQAFYKPTFGSTSRQVG